MRNLRKYTKKLKTIKNKKRVYKYEFNIKIRARKKFLENRLVELKAPFFMEGEELYKAYNIKDYTTKEFIERWYYHTRANEINSFDYFIWNPTLNALGLPPTGNEPNIVTQLEKYITDWNDWIWDEYNHDILTTQGLMDYYLEIGIIEKIPFIGRRNSTQIEIERYEQKQNEEIYKWCEQQLDRYKKNCVGVRKW